MPYYLHLAEVTFRGVFPVDMLRKDMAFPMDEAAVLAIVSRPKVYDDVFWQTVTVGCHSATKTPPWVVNRWRSFGANLVPLPTRLVRVS